MIEKTLKIRKKVQTQVERYGSARPTRTTPSGAVRLSRTNRLSKSLHGKTFRPDGDASNVNESFTSGRWEKSTNNADEAQKLENNLQAPVAKKVVPGKAPSSTAAIQNHAINRNKMRVHSQRITLNRDILSKARAGIQSTTGRWEGNTDKAGETRKGEVNQQAKTAEKVVPEKATSSAAAIQNHALNRNKMRVHSRRITLKRDILSKARAGIQSKLAERDDAGTANISTAVDASIYSAKIYRAARTVSGYTLG